MNLTEGVDANKSKTFGATGSSWDPQPRQFFSVQLLYFSFSLLTFIINKKRPSILPFTERTFPFVTEREKSMGHFFLSWHSSTSQYFFSEFRICDD